MNRIYWMVFAFLLLPAVDASSDSISSKSTSLFGDGMYSEEITISSIKGAPTIAIQGIIFGTDDIEKIITIGLIGGDGSPIATRITAVSGNVITLGEPARTTLKSARTYVVWGHDDTAALRRLFEEGSETRNFDIFPGAGDGMYLVSSAITLPPHTHIKCHGGATIGMLNGWAALDRHWIFVNRDYLGPEVKDDDYVIEGCDFRGNAPQPSGGADAIRMMFAANILVDKNQFRDFGDDTAFIHSRNYSIMNNKGYNAANTCWDNWSADLHVIIDSNYCETRKHGVQVTGTDSAQMASTISHDIVVRNQTVILKTLSGAGIWFNGGQLAVGGSAGVQNALVEGGRVAMSPEMGGHIGTCFKISGPGTSNVRVSGIRCENSLATVNAENGVLGAPSDVHLDHITLELTGEVRGAAIQIKAPRSGVESSSISGSGYRYGIDLDLGDHQYARNNRVRPGYGGDIHIGERSAPTASVGHETLPPTK